MVYTSSSLALAALETLVHADKNSFKRDYLAFHLTIPDTFIETLTNADLPESWRRRVVSEEARALGDAWLTRRSAAVLSVPSAIVPLERNYLLNPLQLDFAKLNIAEPVKFRFDDRL